MSTKAVATMVIVITEDIVIPDGWEPKEVVNHIENRLIEGCRLELDAQQLGLFNLYVYDANVILTVKENG